MRTLLPADLLLTYTTSMVHHIAALQREVEVEVSDSDTATFCKSPAAPLGDSEPGQTPGVDEDAQAEASDSLHSDDDGIAMLYAELRATLHSLAMECHRAEGAPTAY